MRLLHCSDTGEISLTKSFVGDDTIPPYAILSHTWTDGHEVTFQELTNGDGKGKSGYDKIKFCGQEAKRDGLQYFWVDTCCIDKLNLVELQEAINSMFRWYRNAAKCYVYLSDVSTAEWKAGDGFSEYTWKMAFRESRWFTRGWTLQELLAPRSVEFFSKEGKQLGNRRTLKRQLHNITGIAILALRGAPLSEFGIKERLLWARGRQTTRNEDKAYSLFGIFGICMPVLYGEGEKNAFKRLQREIDIASNSPHRKKAASRLDKEAQERAQHLRPTNSRNDKNHVSETNKKESVASTVSQDRRDASFSSFDESDSLPDIEEDSDAASGSEISATKNPLAPLQQESKVQDGEAATEGRASGTQSPSWLKPIVTMPSSIFVENVRRIDPAMHAQFAEMIFSNCRSACFGFYRENKLWRTKYSHQDNDQPTLFQLDKGGFPKSEGDLSLRDWLLKIQRAHYRIGLLDSFAVDDVYDFEGTNGLFRELTGITRLIDPWGRLDIDSVEECLLLSIRLCWHIHGWDSFARLKVVWEELHKHFADVEEAGFRLNLENLMPLLEEPRPTGLTVSSGIPLKRRADTALS
jgi:hypothetical protein